MFTVSMIPLFLHLHPVVLVTPISSKNLLNEMSLGTDSAVLESMICSLAPGLVLGLALALHLMKMCRCDLRIAQIRV